MKQASQPVPYAVLSAFEDGKRAYNEQAGAAPMPKRPLLRWAWMRGFLDADRDWLRRQLILNEIERDD